MAKLYIAVKSSFVGFHRWVNAPEWVSYLRNYHRHVFHVKLKIAVSHGNRAIEFFTLQGELEGFLDEHYRQMQFEESCEMIAEKILNHFKAEEVIVSEDGENEGIAVRDNT